MEVCQYTNFKTFKSYRTPESDRWASFCSEQNTVWKSLAQYWKVTGDWSETEKPWIHLRWLKWVINIIMNERVSRGCGVDAVDISDRCLKWRPKKIWERKYIPDKLFPCSLPERNIWIFPQDVIYNLTTYKFGEFYLAHRIIVLDVIDCIFIFLKIMVGLRAVD